MDGPLPGPISALPLGTAAVALAVRFWLLAGEAALNGLGAEEAREAGEYAPRRSRTIVRLKESRDRTTAILRTALALSMAFFTAMSATVGYGLLAPLGVPAPVGILAGSLLAWVLTSVGDPIPRSIAAERPLDWALRTAPLLALLEKLIRPFAGLASFVGRLVLRPFDAPLRFALPPPPLEDIERLLAESQHEEGAPEPALVKSLFEFGDRTVKEVMVPRTDVFAIPLEATHEQVIDLLVEEGHTRVPVYRGTLDTIVGIVHVKDVLPLLANPELILLHDLLRPCTFVPWNRPIAKVMRDLQRTGQHFAVVVDEYGGMAGIITLEDIVEEIVGDIRDEFDEEPPQVVTTPDGTSVVKAELRVEEFNERFGAELPDDEGFETINGFLNALAGSIPNEGDRFVADGLEFVVLKREPRRVVEVQVRRAEATEGAPGSSGVSGGSGPSS